MFETEMTPPSEMDSLIALSARIGQDITLVQGGGGNTSIKDGGCLWVKASGFWLSQATAQNIFVPVALAPLRAALAGPMDDAIEISAMDMSSLRPSIETSLHAALPHRVVLHVHSVNTIAWTLRPDGREALDARLDGLRWAWIPYARPGLPLTRAVCHGSGREVDVIILANHGLVLGADSCADAEALLKNVEDRLDIAPRPATSPRLDVLGRIAAEYGCIFPTDQAVHAIAFEPSLSLALGGPLYPDHLVFLGVDVPLIRADGTVRRPLTDTCPFALVENAGIIVKPDISDGALAMLQAWSAVLSRIGNGTDLRYLSNSECGDLLGWEAEDYRKKIEAR